MFLFAFLPAVLAVYYLLPRRFRNAFLLLADLVFYGWGEPVMVLLMIFSIVINYFAGILIEKTADAGSKNAKKTILVLSVILDLGILGFFKYAGFLTENLRIVLPFLNIPLIRLPLPIGISFYTFQILSYTVDVYRGDTGAQKNLIDFGTYVSLFPQLIAGPIVRYRDVDAQLSGRRENLGQFSRGVLLFVLGLSKKVLIANAVGRLWDVLRESADSSVLGAWVGVIAFSFQIYFDFSGYSDMARGLGKMFGFEFCENFDYPYISASVTEFWRRWHISLGTWFREYLYIPLGGNRRGTARTVFNLAAVWLLTGLWHGAGWNFVLWGAYFGLLLILEKLFLLKALKKLPSFLPHLYALFFVALGWVLFYFADDVGGFPAMLGFLPRLFRGPLVTSDDLSAVLSSLPLLAAAAVASTPLIRRVYRALRKKRVKGLFIVEAAAVAAVLLLSTASLAADSYNPFLYFKF